MAQQATGDNVVKQHLHKPSKPKDDMDWRPVLVTERVSGSLADLLEHLKTGDKLPPHVICKMAVDWATGLKRLHEQYQLVHNDVKPGNLFIRIVRGYDSVDWVRLVIDGQTKAFEGAIGDFGVAQQRGAEPAHRFDRNRDKYKAPEQDQNRPPGRRYPTDPRTDLYGLGNVLKMLAVHCSSDYPSQMKELINSCCADDIDDRPVTAAAALKKLGEIEGDVMNPEVDLPALIRLLNAMPPQQFGQLVLLLKVPEGLIPSTYAPQGDRTNSLINWAKGPSGCGLRKLRETGQKIVNPQ